jgi:hypothetical protein
MFKTKYKVTLLNVKWDIIKKDVKLSVIPRKDEYIYLNNQYYEVLNIIHDINNKENILLVINELKENIKNNT